MDTNKIREALEAAIDEHNHYHSSYSKVIGHVRDALAELNKAEAGREVLTDEHHCIIAERMVEEHRKYGDRLAPGEWADVAAHKVFGTLRELGYIAPAPSEPVLTVAQASCAVDKALHQIGYNLSDADIDYIDVALTLTAAANTTKQ